MGTCVRDGTGVSVEPHLILGGVLFEWFLTNHCTPLTKNHNNSIEDRCLWNRKLSKNAWRVGDVTAVTTVVAPDQLCSGSCAPKQQDWAGSLPPVFFTLKDPLGLLGPLSPPLSHSSSLFLGPPGSYCFFPPLGSAAYSSFTFPFPVCSESSCFVFLAPHLCSVYKMK